MFYFAPVPVCPEYAKRHSWAPSFSTVLISRDWIALRVAIWPEANRWHAVSICGRAADPHGISRVGSVTPVQMVPPEPVKSVKRQSARAIRTLAARQHSTQGRVTVREVVLQRHDNMAQDHHPVKYPTKPKSAPEWASRPTRPSVAGTERRFPPRPRPRASSCQPQTRRRPEIRAAIPPPTSPKAD